MAYGKMRRKKEIEARLKAYISALSKDAMPAQYYDTLKELIQELEWVLARPSGFKKEGENADRERDTDKAPGDGDGEEAPGGDNPELFPAGPEPNGPAEGAEGSRDEDPRTDVGALCIRR
jgi:hypothetical protein